MLFNFVLYLAFLTFLDSGVTDESFVDETRVWRKQKKNNPGIYDELIYNYWVDAIAGGVLFPEGITSPVVSTSVLT